MADSTIGTAPGQRPPNATRGTRRAGKAGTLAPMRVLLVEPATNAPGSYGQRAGEDPVGEHERPLSTMRITLPLLAALMPPEVDATIAYDQCRELERDLDFGAYDLVGLTCTTHTGQIARAAELAALSRRRGTPCIVGGPVTVPQNHHFVPLLAEHFDSVIVGEAEPVLFDVLSDVQNHQLRPTYESVGFQPFENVPIPRFDLIDLNNFSPPHVFPVQTARGCPHHCAFCSEFLYTPWRFRPVPEVIAELLRYKSEFGADRLIFRDDDFLVHPKRSHELLTQLQTLDLAWACQTDLSVSRRLDLANLAVDAGLRAVAFGLESISEVNRKAIDKTFFALKDVGRLLRTLRERQVELQINIIFGFDDDGPDVFDTTVDFMLEHGVSTFYANILDPEPGSPLYETLKAQGRILKDGPLEVEAPENVTYIPKGMSAEELVTGTKYARDRFHAERRKDLPYWRGIDKTEY